VIAYWILFGLFAGGALLSESQEQRPSRRWLLTIFIVLLALFVGLRWEIGPDWRAYHSMYREMRNVGIGGALEQSDPGFRVILSALQAARAPFFVLNLICAGIFAFGLARFATSLPNPWLAVLIAIPYLVVVIAMSALRQATAIGFIFLALRGMGAKPLWKSIFWVLVASLFHASAIIVAVLIALSYSRNRLEAAVVILASAFPAYYVLVGTFDNYLHRYAQRLIDSGGVAFRVAMNAVPAIVLLTMGSERFSPPGEQAFWRNLSILSLALGPPLFFVSSTTAIDRLSLYAVPLQMLVLSGLPRQLSSTAGTRIYPVMMLIGYCALTLLVFFTLGTHARYYLPYRLVDLWSL
jgi:hypothetical protein